MTRINSAIPVKSLTDEHLLAEHREIKRLPYCLGKAIINGKVKKLPNKFTLGNGHVSFFYDKMAFVEKRYIEIYEECIRRGFNVTDYRGNFDKVQIRYYNNYKPTEEEKQLLIQRISNRIKESKKKYWHYNKAPISKENSIKLLKE